MKVMLDPLSAAVTEELPPFETLQFLMAIHDNCFKNFCLFFVSLKSEKKALDYLSDVL